MNIVTPSICSLDDFHHDKLESFFSKIPKRRTLEAVQSVTPTDNPSSAASVTDDENQSIIGHSNQATESSTIEQTSTAPEQASITTEQPDDNDIGLYVRKKCTDEEKFILLKNRWLPPENYTFPASKIRNLKFQRKWLIDFPWLAYSKSLDGAFCQFCCLFCVSSVGKGNVQAKSLVKEPFSRWKDALEQFRLHQDAIYHKNALVTAQNFVDVQEKKVIDISVQLDKAKQKEIEQNRRILKSIVETIILTGRQDIALSVHRDWGKLFPEPTTNDGNFRALLRFRIKSGDSQLKEHLENSKYRYISPSTQNQLINICGDYIVEKIVSKINESGMFSILADETSDVSGIEQ